jgi:hypothetical protein
VFAEEVAGTNLSLALVTVNGRVTELRVGAIDTSNGNPGSIGIAQADDKTYWLLTSGATKIVRVTIRVRK